MFVFFKFDAAVHFLHVFDENRKPRNPSNTLVHGSHLHQQADDINAMFREWVPEGTVFLGILSSHKWQECLFSKEQFAMRLDEEAQFKPVGELVNVKTSKGRALEVYLVGV